MLLRNWLLIFRRIRLVRSLTPAIGKQQDAGWRWNHRSIHRRRAALDRLEPRLPLAYQAQLVADVAPAVATSLPSSYTEVGDTTYFIATDTLHGRELWKTDGTPPPVRRW